MQDYSIGYGLDELSVFLILLQTDVRSLFHETCFFVTIFSGIGSFLSWSVIGD